jgi:hypothetical protein
MVTPRALLACITLHVHITQYAAFVRAHTHHVGYIAQSAHLGVGDRTAWGMDEALPSGHQPIQPTTNQHSDVG